MKHHISGLFIVLNLLFAVVQSAEWEMIYRSVIQFQAVWGSASNNVFAVGYGAIFHYDGSSWSEMDTETYYDLNGIWGSSSSDVFAVGATIGGEKGVILHYDGNQWTLMNSGTHSYLSDIWGNSSSDVFAVGEKGTILHYDGNNWTSMNSRTDSGLNSIWGSSSADVFAVGEEGTILHYNGNQWTRTNVGTNSFYINSIWGSSNTNVFAVGRDNSNGRHTILHYNGNQWTPMNTGINAYDLRSIWGSSGTSLFAAGWDNMTHNQTIFRYNGNQWIPMNTGIIDPSHYINNIWGSSSTDIFAVGERDTILHYDGNQWIPMNTGTNSYFLNSIWASSSTDVFAGGSDENGNAAILHYDGNQWTPINIGINFREVQSIWGSSSTDIFAGTYYGPMLHYDGNQWTPINTGDNYFYNSIINNIWGSSGTNVFAGGWHIDCDDCYINFHYDGNQWTPMNTGIGYISNIWGSSSTDMFALGRSCNGTTCHTIFHYDGNQWTPIDIGINSFHHLLCIWGSSSTDVFAGGSTTKENQATIATIFHYDGNQWTPMNIETNVGSVHSIWGSSSTEVFASVSSVGNNKIFHYDGSTWTKIANINSSYGKIWGIAENDVLFVTSRGILHYGCIDCNQNNFKVNPRSHNFWNVAIGNQASKIFTVSNISNNEVQLQTLTLTNTTNFTLNNDTCSNALLIPSGTCQVTVNFQPQTAGTQLTKLTLPSDLETIEVPLSGTGCSSTFQQQAFYLYPKSPNLGTTLVGNPLTLKQAVSFTATQGCGEPLYLDKIEVNGQDTTEFEVKDTQCYRSSYGKESYSYCQFNTVFNATTTGEKQAELTFKLFEHEELPMPTVALQAKAVDAGQAQLDLTPSEHDFGTIIIGRGSSEPLSLVVTNLGEVSLTIDNITLIVDNAADFSLESGSCNAIDILPPNAKCYINAWFRPTVIGQKQARVIVTAGDLNAEALLTGIAEESQDCTNLVTIESVQNGRWDTASTWSTATIPTVTDVVRINEGNTVTGQELAQIKTLCVQAGATLESLDDQGTALEIQATDYLENRGVIRGKDGSNETQSDCNQENLGTAGCAQPGASVLLKVGTGFDKYGKLGDWWWKGSGGPIFNQGEIVAGKGGDGSQYGAPGGDAIVLGHNTTNANRIQAGDGGDVLGTETGQGGRGGLTQIWGNLGGPGHLYVQNGAQALAGKGGNCNPQGQQTGGDGGNLWLVSLPNVYIEGGIAEAGSGGQGCATLGQDGFVQIEPNVISLAGATTHVKGGDIAIYGGNDWILDLSNLSGNVIEASGNLTLAVGKGGLIDFRNSDQILAAKEVQIFADNIRLDTGKPISSYIDAENFVVGPSKLLRNVSLIVTNKLFGNPGEIISIPLVIANNGPEDDQYTITVTDSAGNILNKLPDVEVKLLDTVNLAIDITIPASNKVIFAAVSQSDPEVSATSEVILTTKPITSGDGNLVLPEEANQPASDDNQISLEEANQPTNDNSQILPEEANQPTSDDNQTTPEGNQFEPENNEDKLISNNDVVVVEEPTINICHVTLDGIINWTCINKEQILTDVIFKSNAKVSGGQLAGMIDNQGFISQVVIQADTVLKGGKLSGYIVNQGTLMDFEFVGAQVIGGILAGQVINNSFIGGVFKDVNLAADAHLIGGYLQGQIQGDPSAPALLEEVAIQAGSHLAYVKIGKNVTWSADVVFEDNVEFIEPMTYCNPNLLTDIVPSLPSLDPMVFGNPTQPCTQLVGGLSTDGKRFQRQLTVTLAEPVKILGRIAPDLRQVNQTVDFVLSAAYRAVETEPPLYFMVDVQGQILPWDGDVSHLVAFKEPMKLELVQSLRLYHDKIPAMGQVAIQFGYRLADGTVVLNEQPLEIKVVK
jgi:hypothetical protein